MYLGEVFYKRAGASVYAMVQEQIDQSEKQMRGAYTQVAPWCVVCHGQYETTIDRHGELGAITCGKTLCFEKWLARSGGAFESWYFSGVGSVHDLVDMGAVMPHMKLTEMIRDDMVAKKSKQSFSHCDGSIRDLYESFEKSGPVEIRESGVMLSGMGQEFMPMDHALMLARSAMAENRQTPGAGAASLGQGPAGLWRKPDFLDDGSVQTALAMEDPDQANVEMSKWRDATNLKLGAVRHWQIEPDGAGRGYCYMTAVNEGQQHVYKPPPGYRSYIIGHMCHYVDGKKRAEPVCKCCAMGDDCPISDDAHAFGVTKVTCSPKSVSKLAEMVLLKPGCRGVIANVMEVRSGRAVIVAIAQDCDVKDTVLGRIEGTEASVRKEDPLGTVLFPQKVGHSSSYNAKRLANSRIDDGVKMARLLGMPSQFGKMLREEGASLSVSNQHVVWTGKTVFSTARAVAAMDKLSIEVDKRSSQSQEVGQRIARERLRSTIAAQHGQLRMLCQLKLDNEALLDARLKGRDEDDDTWSLLSVHNSIASGVTSVGVSSMGGVDTNEARMLHLEGAYTAVYANVDEINGLLGSSCRLVRSGVVIHMQEAGDMNSSWDSTVSLEYCQTVTTLQKVISHSPMGPNLQPMCYVPGMPALKVNSQRSSETKGGVNVKLRGYYICFRGDNNVDMAEKNEDGDYKIQSKGQFWGVTGKTDPKAHVSGRSWKTKQVSTATDMGDAFYFAVAEQDVGCTAMMTMWLIPAVRATHASRLFDPAGSEEEKHCHYLALRSSEVIVERELKYSEFVARVLFTVTKEDKVFADQWRMAQTSGSIVPLPGGRCGLFTHEKLLEHWPNGWATSAKRHLLNEVSEGRTWGVACGHESSFAAAGMYEESGSDINDTEDRDEEQAEE
uniref:Uncharacterized protein n=1 Tax=viral metagenome TaxID=1070528 RepID=A0A2V0RH67_9ZZZZ